MKIILSHDVDHINCWEHYNDTIIPKHLIRSSIELIYRSITLDEYKYRLKELFVNKWNYVDDIIKFEKDNCVSSTFFIGVNNGLGLKYSIEEAEILVNKILSNGFDVGVHGISYIHQKDIEDEYNCFKKISKLNNFGIRQHYLRTIDTTLKDISLSGYLYDSSVYEFKNPYLINEMWEFPLQLMDSMIVRKRGSLLSKDYDTIKRETLKSIQKAERLHLKYFSILFHDRYFNEGFKTWKDWYEWLILFLINQGYTFISYNDAIKELNEY